MVKVSMLYRSQHFGVAIEIHPPPPFLCLNFLVSVPITLAISSHVMVCIDMVAWIQRIRDKDIQQNKC